MSITKPRLIVGISGASGAPLGVALLRTLRALDCFEVHLVITAGGERTIASETDCTLGEVQSLAHVCHPIHDIGASIASGSFATAGMVVIPCAMKTVAGIACGYSDNLLLRAADVVLKEGRKLVLVPRETPMSQIHLRNLLTLSQMGVTILPPVLTYYSGGTTAEEMANHIVGKVLDQFGVDAPHFHRWEGDAP